MKKVLLFFYLMLAMAAQAQSLDGKWKSEAAKMNLEKMEFQGEESVELQIVSQTDTTLAIRDDKDKEMVFTRVKEE